MSVAAPTVVGEGLESGRVASEGRVAGAGSEAEAMGAEDTE